MTTIVKKEEDKSLGETGFTVWPFIDKIYVARLDINATLPTRKHQGDAGLDFYALHDTLIQPRQVKVVRTGITVELPAHYFGLLKPKGRSNLNIWAGVVDPTYQGEVLFKVYNPYDETMSFLAGQPVGQMIIIPIIRPPIVEISPDEIHKEKSDRGETGGILEDVE